MDKIDYKIKYTSHEKQKFYDIDLYLNDTLLPHQVLNTYEFLAAQGIPLVEFDLFTCTCGISGCAGFHLPIKQSTTDKKISWLFQKNSGYKTNQSIYEFDKKQFLSKIKQIKTKVIKMESLSIHSMLNYDYYTESESQTDNEQNVETIISRYHDMLKLEFEYSDLCSKHMPFLTNLSFEHDGDIDNYLYPPELLVHRIMNQSPKPNSDNKLFWKNVVEACEAVNSFVLNNDNTKILELEKKYHKNDGSSIVQALFFQNNGTPVNKKNVLDSTLLKVKMV